MKVGDTVMLKGGGPAMIVQGIGFVNIVRRRADEVECVWFDRTHRLCTAYFAPELLIPVDPKDCPANGVPA